MVIHPFFNYMKIIIASNNKHKIAEIKEILGDGYEFYSQRDMGVTDEAVEDGETFSENSYIKAKFIADKFPDYATLADDSGLAVDYLNGAPGVNSARYCGVHGRDDDNNAKLLKEMQGVTNRNAAFVCAMTLILPSGRVLASEGRTEGYVMDRVEGEHGFGYDPLFFSLEINKCFGLATEEEKNSVSHRGKALRALKMMLKATGEA